MKRREAIKNTALASAFGVLLPFKNQKEKKEKKSMLKGNINHSVCDWCYPGLTLEELCIEAKRIGLVGIDLVKPKDFSILKKYGLISTMTEGAEITQKESVNDPSYHSKLKDRYINHIDYVSKAGYKNLICFSGNRKGMDDETGLNNCVLGLKNILSYAEKKGVIILMELFNSKVNHPDYMCDNTEWAIELCKRLDSPNFKLLYDIYHMQIEEGDIIRTINDNHFYFGHYHTAGVPGRNEINSSQELNYPAIMKAIVKTGYSGFVAQEFRPTRHNPIESLEEAINICDV